MEFIATSHNNQALIYNDYLYFHKKTNKNGSLIWRCQQKCGVTCTTIWNGVTNIFIRLSPLPHNHEAPSTGKKLAMEFVNQVATEVPKSNQPLQKIWEKSQAKFLRGI